MLFYFSYRCRCFRRASRTPRNLSVCKRGSSIFNSFFSQATIADFYSASIEAAISLAEVDPHSATPPSLLVVSFICSRISFQFSDSNSSNLLLEPRSINILREYPLDVRQTTNGAALGDPAALEAAPRKIQINIAVATIPF
jgi:hypothetical protein